MAKSGETFKEFPLAWVWYTTCTSKYGCPSEDVTNDYVSYMGDIAEFYLYATHTGKIREPYRQEFVKRFVAWQKSGTSSNTKDTLLTEWGIDIKSGWADIVKYTIAQAQLWCATHSNQCKSLYTHGKKTFDSEDTELINQSESKLMDELFLFSLKSEKFVKERRHFIGDTLISSKYPTWYSVAKIFYKKGYHPDLWDNLVDDIYNKLYNKIKLHKLWVKRHQEWLDNQKKTQAKHDAWLKAQAAAQAQATAQAQAAAQVQAGSIPPTPSGFTNVEPPLTSVGKPKSKNQLILVAGGALVLGVAIYEFVIKKR